jgi:hypothetical protein
MKNTAIVVLCLVAIALVMMSYGTFSAVGQSRGFGSWQIQTSAAFAPAAWKINTETGTAYDCVAQQQVCLQMRDQ